MAVVAAAAAAAAAAALSASPDDYWSVAPGFSLCWSERGGGRKGLRASQHFYPGKVCTYGYGDLLHVHAHQGEDDDNRKDMSEAERAQEKERLRRQQT